MVSDPLETRIVRSWRKGATRSITTDPVDHLQATGGGRDGRWWHHDVPSATLREGPRVPQIGRLIIAQD